MSEDDAIILNNSQRHVVQTKYFYGGQEIFVDFCFEFSGLVLGSAGAVGVGYYTGFFNRSPPSLIHSVPGQMKALGDIHPKAYRNLKQYNKILAGGSLGWRISKRAALGSLLYCFLECKLQGRRYYRSITDCALAGAISGAIFGARGGVPKAGLSALGFSAFAMVSHILYH